MQAIYCEERTTKQHLLYRLVGVLLTFTLSIGSALAFAPPAFAGTATKSSSPSDSVPPLDPAQRQQMELLATTLAQALVLNQNGTADLHREQLSTLSAEQRQAAEALVSGINAKH